jgi:hypothetical protein
VPACPAAQAQGVSAITDFKVQPQELHALAKLVDRAREDVDAGKTYLQKVMDFQGGVGLINQLTGGHKEAYQAMDAWLGKLANPTLTTVSGNVTAAAKYYQRTDEKSAKKLDGTYPETNVTEIREHAGYNPTWAPAGTGRFQDVSEPQGRLTAPKDYNQELDASVDWWDTFSPMAQIGNALEAVSHVGVWMGLLSRPIDPQAEVVRPFVGDWAGMRRAADVLQNVGHELRDIASNIKWASQGTEQVWRGNAGDGAAIYLMNLARPLHDAWDPIDKLSAKYVEASGDMVKFRDAVVAILNMVGDAAIEAALSYAVAAGSASTGVGAPVAVAASLFGSYKVYKVVDGIKDMFEIIGKLDTVIKAVQAVQTDGGNIQNTGKLPTLPHTNMSVPK